MSASSSNQQFLAFLRLNAEGEIDWVDPQLFEDLSHELKDWIGLPFLQWVNYAYLHVSDLTQGEVEGVASKTLSAGKTKDTPEFIFRMISAPEQYMVQVCRVISPAASAKHPGVSMVYGESDETRLQHFWNQLLSWMIPGFLHDANNNISALVSLAQCLTSAVDEEAVWNEEQKEDLDAMLHCSQETGKIFLFLSKVYKWNASHENYHDLGELFSDIARLVDIALPGTYIIDVAPAASGMHVYLNPAHLAQMILGQLSVWFPDRNQRHQGTVYLKVEPSQEITEGFAEVVGTRPSQPCWVIQMRLDGALAQKRSSSKGSDFQSSIKPLLVAELQGAFLAHQREPLWILELPQARLTEP